MRCPRSPAKKRPFGRSPASAAKEQSCCTLMSCASSIYGKLKRRILALLQDHGKYTEHCCVGYHPLICQSLSDTLEHGPQQGTFSLRKSGLASQPPYIAVCLPAIQLPCIDHVLPLTEQEAVAESVIFDLIGRFRQQRADRLP
jgi:hypothetical protein